MGRLGDLGYPIFAKWTLLILICRPSIYLGPVSPFSVTRSCALRRPYGSTAFRAIGAGAAFELNAKVVSAIRTEVMTARATKRKAGDCEEKQDEKGRSEDKNPDVYEAATIILRSA
jgi:hypothetical protein